MTDDYMESSVEDLEKAVVGHKIVDIKTVDPKDWYGCTTAHEITLDNGTKVELQGTSECCAYAELETFLLHADKIDHVITGVRTEDDYQTWHIYADMGDVLDLTVGWSEGSGYYGYGFYVTVKPLDN